MSVGNLKDYGNKGNNTPFQIGMLQELKRIEEAILTGVSSAVPVSGKTASITGTGDTAVIAAPGSSLKLYITNILVTNGHATVGTYVNIKNGATTIYTGYASAAGGGFSVTLSKPLVLSTNTTLNAACETTGSDVRVSASGYKDA